MRFKIVDVALSFAAVIGFAMTLSAFSERSKLIAEYENYVAQVGRLRVKDTGKIYAKRIATDVPEHFAWRVYLPPPNGRGIEARTFNGNDVGGESFSHPTSDAGNETTIRVTLRRTDEGVVACIDSALSKIKDKRVADFISQHWDDLRFEIMGDEVVLVQDGDQAIKLLDVTLPKRLADEFVAEHGEEFRAAIANPFSFYYGYAGAKGTPQPDAGVKGRLSR